MKRSINALDRILRGEATRPAVLRERGLDVPIGGLCLTVLLLAVFYGICMGFFAGFREGGPHFQQWLAGAVKTPALFVLTLAVTFPSLYVFNALVGSRLNLTAVVRLLIASLAVNVALLASLGPVVAFFSVSTTSHSFVVVLNVLVFAVSALFGFGFLLKTLHRLMAAQRLTTPADRDCEEPSETGPIEAQLADRERLPDDRVKTLFTCWMIVTSLVGAQMTWVLRPLVGDGSGPFHWFSARESNFFNGFLDILRGFYQ
ncbi:MAG: hypothetical protein ABFC96_14485 [Thermoguttaceae bacterium]